MTITEDFGFRPRRDFEAKDNEFGFIPRHAQRDEGEEESLSENIGRQGGRTGARIVETILGAPRALGEFGESLIPEKLITKGAEKIGLREPIEKGFEVTKKYAPYKLFPKSEDVRGITKSFFGDKYEPKNQWEKKADDLVSDFVALALPFPGSKLKLLKPGILAAGGNIASDIVGRLGGKEREQTYAKLGTFLLGSMINPKSAENLKNELYREARNFLPADAKMHSKNLSSNIQHLRSNLKKGSESASSKSKTLKVIDEIDSKIKNNEIKVDELEEFKRNINEARSGLYEEFSTDKVGRASAKRNLDSVSKIVDDALNEYGKSNPEWESFYRPANEVHGAIAQSKRARNFISKQMKKYGHHALLPLVGIGHFAGPAHTIEGLAISGGLGAAAVTGGEILAKIRKSPTIRKHYINLITSALKEDAVAAEENLKKLDKELED